jgi:hypothetical protein
MGKPDRTFMTFKPNTAPRTFSDFANPDSLSMDKIPYMDFLRMVAKYRDERQQVINEHFKGSSNGDYGDDFEDSRYFYISVASLERYLTYVKQKIRTNNLNVEFTGVRIYPIVYTNSGTSDYFSSIPSVYRNHTSIVFTPTYMSEGGYAIDFDPDIYTANPSGSGNIPKSLEKLNNQSISAFFTSTFTGSVHAEYTAQDHVWMCPPPRPCLPGASGLTNADNICPDGVACPY